MGSSGSGRFDTYPRGEAKAREMGCPAVIENIKLEDVAVSEYHLRYKNVPTVNEAVELSTQLVNKRLVVVLSDTQEIIGNLPVSYNYLSLCMKKGKRYSGIIKASGMAPIPYIVVDLYA